MQYTSTRDGNASSARSALTCNSSKILTVALKSNALASLASLGAVNTVISLELQHGVHAGTAYTQRLKHITPRQYDAVAINTRDALQKTLGRVARARKVTPPLQY